MSLQEQQRVGRQRAGLAQGEAGIPSFPLLTGQLGLCWEVGVQPRAKQLDPPPVPQLHSRGGRWRRNWINKRVISRKF